MKYKIIAVDLDGTTLRKDGRTLSKRVEDAFTKAREMGIEIVLNTGRPYKVLAPSLLTGAGWQHLCVLCNGGEIRNLQNGELLDKRYMKGQDLVQFVELAKKWGIPAELMLPEKIYLTREDWDKVNAYGGPELGHHIHYALKERGEAVDSLLKLCQEPDAAFVKALYPLIDDEVREQVEEGLKAMDLSFAWAGRKSIEVTHKEANKAKGLERVCSLLHVPMNQVMAIGDSGNDIPMLKSAGMGIAMGNAPSEVKAAADAVTATNEEDGVALAIETYVLNRV